MIIANEAQTTTHPWKFTTVIPENEKTGPPHLHGHCQWGETEGW